MSHSLFSPLYCSGFSKKDRQRNRSRSPPQGQREAKQDSNKPGAEQDPKHQIIYRSAFSRWIESTDPMRCKDNTRTTFFSLARAHAATIPFNNRVASERSVRSPSRKVRRCSLPPFNSREARSGKASILMDPSGVDGNLINCCC